MGELTFEEQLVEDVKLLTAEELFKKAASHGMGMNNLFGFLSKILKEKYEDEYRVALFKNSLHELIVNHGYKFTPKEASFIINHTLGTIIVEDCHLVETKQPGIFKPH